MYNVKLMSTARSVRRQAPSAVKALGRSRALQQRKLCLDQLLRL